MLNWLGDLGGLKEAVTIILTFIYGLFNYYTFQNYLVSQLYRAETMKDRISAKAGFYKTDDDRDQDLYMQK